MSPSLYDTAWLLRLRDGSGGPCFPETLEWLLARQHPDGSWGSRIRFYHHDRVVCTLIAAIALVELQPTPEIRLSIVRAEKFLWQHLHLVYRDAAFPELVGFELLFPMLLDEARRNGLRVPAHNYGISSLKAEKLRLVPPDKLYSKTVSTVHSLEFLGPGARAADLHTAVFDNGSLGNSPATTAYYLKRCMASGVPPAPKAQEYLARIGAGNGPSVYLHPFRNFELLWVLNNLTLIDRSARFTSDLPAGFLDHLEMHMGEEGIALDDEFGIPDADCTSVACYLLALAGRTVDPSALHGYEIPGERTFRTYSYERNPSLSTNLHALEALRWMPDYPDRFVVMDRIEMMLFANRRFNLFWTDKWHASPYYATAYVLVTLLDGDQPIHPGCLDTIDWLVHNQREDGSWGYFDRGTAEETAYALLALQQAYRFGLVPVDSLKRGVGFLLAQDAVSGAAPDYVELWLGKCLYAPIDIIRSVILTALFRHELIFGRLG